MESLRHTEDLVLENPRCRPLCPGHICEDPSWTAVSACCVSSLSHSTGWHETLSAGLGNLRSWHRDSLIATLPWEAKSLQMTSRVIQPSFVQSVALQVENSPDDQSQLSPKHASLLMGRSRPSFSSITSHGDCQNVTSTAAPCGGSALQCQ